MDKRDRLTTVASFAVLTGPIVISAIIYIAGYFILGDLCVGEGELVRTFRSEWLVTLYKPAAIIESGLLGCPIELQARQ